MVVNFERRCSQLTNWLAFLSPLAAAGLDVNIEPRNISNRVMMVSVSGFQLIAYDVHNRSHCHDTEPPQISRSSQIRMAILYV